MGLKLSGLSIVRIPHSLPVAASPQAGTFSRDLYAVRFAHCAKRALEMANFSIDDTGGQNYLLLL